MNNRKTISLFVVGALAVGAALGLFAYNLAYAQESTPEAPSSPPFSKGMEGYVPGGLIHEDLADALGISEDELDTAIQSANEAALEQAVQSGLITQDQADQLRERGLSAKLFGRMGGWPLRAGIDYQALLAEALGISPDELREAYTQAFETRISRAVEEGTISPEQADLIGGHYALANSESFQTAMRSAFEAAVNEAVANGTITQAQADQILDHAAGMKFGGFGFGRGFHGGGLGRHGWRGINPTIPQTPDNPEITPSSDA
jgi:hypothetical protein